MIINNSAHPHRRISLSPKMLSSPNQFTLNRIEKNRSNRSSSLQSQTVKLVTFTKEDRKTLSSTGCKSNISSSTMHRTTASELNSSSKKAIESFKQINFDCEATTIKISLETKFNLKDDEIILIHRDESNTNSNRNSKINLNTNNTCGGINLLNITPTQNHEICASSDNSLNKAFILSSNFSGTDSVKFSQISSIDTFSEPNSNFLTLSTRNMLLESETKNLNQKRFVPLISFKLPQIKKNKVSPIPEATYSHKELPEGKENNEKFKLAMINKKVRKVENPPFNSDFGKKRCYHEMMNRTNSEVSVFDEKNIANKFRKISSCKKVYESVLYFQDNKKNKFPFKLYKEEDIGLKKINFDELLRVNDYDEDVETDEDYLKLTNFHVIGTACEAIKELANDQELWEEIKNRRKE